MSSPRHPLLDVTRLFLRLGCTSFGGPAAHVALIERECVRRLGWLSREQFLDILSVANLIPGPTSTELAMHVGHHRAGWPGLIAAGLAFIAPAAVLVALLAALYVQGSELAIVRDILRAVQPVVLVVVLDATVPLSRTALATPRTAAIGVGALAAAAAGVPAIAILILAGLVHIVVAGRAVTAILLFAAAAIPLAAAAPAVARASEWEVFVYFMRVGSLLFGSGYVLLPVLEQELVHDRRWITATQLVDAIAVGQATPGPVFTTATFIGYVMGGLPVAVIATVGMFLPAFVFSALSARYVARLRQFAIARRFLAGVNAAAVALIAWVLIALGRDVLVAPLPIATCLVAASLVLVLRVNPSWVLAGAALLGALSGGVSGWMR